MNKDLRYLKLYLKVFSY